MIKHYAKPKYNIYFGVESSLNTNVEIRCQKKKNTNVEIHCL